MLHYTGGVDALATVCIECPFPSCCITSKAQAADSDNLQCCQHQAAAHATSPIATTPTNCMVMLASGLHLEGPVASCCQPDEGLLLRSATYIGHWCMHDRLIDSCALCHTPHCCSKIALKHKCLYSILTSFVGCFRCRIPGKIGKHTVGRPCNLHPGTP